MHTLALSLNFDLPDDDLTNEPPHLARETFRPLALANQRDTVGSDCARGRARRPLEQYSGARLEDQRLLPADIGLRARLPDLNVWAEMAWAPGRPMADNPAGSWCPPSAVAPVLGAGHQGHYTG